MSATNSGAVVPKYKVMVIGKTGAGKSSFCNFVLGRKAFEASSGLEAITGKAAAHSVSVKGYELYLIDTPGFGDPTSMEDKGDMGIQEMARGLQLAVQDGDPGIDVIVYVISAAGRFTNEEHTVIEAIKDSQFWSHSLVVFTNADRVDDWDKFQYIQSVLRRPKCPEGLKLLMDRVEGRFMILNSLDPRPGYRDDHLRTFIFNLCSLNEKNNGKRFSHQLFVDVHEKYMDLKSQSKTQSKEIEILLEQADDMRESYMAEIDELESTITSQRDEMQKLKLQGQNVEELDSGISANEEEKRRIEQNLRAKEDEVKELEVQIEECTANYNQEVEEKERLQLDVKRLQRELDEKKCPRRHCLLL